MKKVSYETTIMFLEGWLGKAVVQVLWALHPISITQDNLLNAIKVLKLDINVGMTLTMAIVKGILLRHMSISIGGHDKNHLLKR